MVKDAREGLCYKKWVLIYLIGILSGVGCKPDNNTFQDWNVYKGDDGSSSYSELTQINKSNVDELEVAWTYRTGDLEEDSHSTIETNPIVVGDVLYGASPFLKVFAVDAVTGEEKWIFDPFEDQRPGGYLRSVVYWEDGADKRIIASAGTDLYALHAETGELVSEFGNEGRVDLNEGLGRNPDSISVKAPSPGIVYKDLLIMGSATGEGYDSAPGHIRAYDIRSGEIVWTFHTIPKPGEFGYNTWGNVPEGEEIKKGGVNNWAGMSLDKERGIVYIPLGSPTYDFYGGDRPGKNLFGNSLLALDAGTGEYIWHYQTIHHDLWDYDLPAPPNLVTVERGGEPVYAVAQVTKLGFTYLFNRVTGEPLFSIKEKPVPKSNIESEKAWPTQPYPAKPEPFIRQDFTKDEITDISQESHNSVLAKFSEYRHEGLFTPPDPEGSVISPSTRGGANWGGAAYDPETGLLFINANETPGISTVQKVELKTTSGGTLYDRGRTFYQQNCATCHGQDREGQHPVYPALSDLGETSTKEDVTSIIESGSGLMPAFPGISEEEKNAIVAFLFNEKDTGDDIQNIEEEAEPDRRYINTTAYSRFEDSGGYPAIKPPWGSINAIDLNSGEIKWKKPIGTYPELAEKGIPPTGMESWGGPIVTAGGLVFIAATADKRFRAYDKKTGEILWETTLPTGGFATPSTYMVDGKQYIVIAAGGGRGTRPGDYYVAFKLPE